MNINLRELRLITNRLLDHVIDDRGVEEVDLVEDYYWTIAPEQRYKVDKDPLELEVGSLATDLEMVSSMLDNQNLPVAYLLTELAPLLNYVGERLASELAAKGG